MVAIQVHIFLMCFNEEVLLPHTIEHYRRCSQNCAITILDDDSSDKSVEIATALGCSVIPMNKPPGALNSHLQLIKNECWKQVESGWVIVADMDEWLCFSERDLRREMRKGTNVLRVIGYNMTGFSQSALLDDVDLHSVNRGIFNQWESKNLCFLVPEVKAMNYGPGAHACSPEGGGIKYSRKHYINKHMSHLGCQYFLTRVKAGYSRRIEDKKLGWSLGHTEDDQVLLGYHKYQQEHHSNIYASKWQILLKKKIEKIFRSGKQLIKWSVHRW